MFNLIEYTLFVFSWGRTNKMILLPNNVLFVFSLTTAWPCDYILGQKRGFCF